MHPQCAQCIRFFNSYLPPDSFFAAHLSRAEGIDLPLRVEVCLNTGGDPQARVLLAVAAGEISIDGQQVARVTPIWSRGSYETEYAGLSPPDAWLARLKSRGGVLRHKTARGECGRTVKYSDANKAVVGVVPVHSFGAAAAFLKRTHTAHPDAYVDNADYDQDSHATLKACLTGGRPLNDLVGAIYNVVGAGYAHPLLLGPPEEWSAPGVLDIFTELMSKDMDPFSDVRVFLGLVAAQLTVSAATQLAAQLAAYLAETTAAS